MNRRFIIAVGVVVILVAGISWFSGGFNKKRSPAKVDVTASFYPLAEFARRVGGNKVRVNNITPVGAEPHDFEPSPLDIIKIEQSRVFIYSGGNFEPWADKIVPGLKDVIIVNASRGIPLIKNDPHFYLDPVLDRKVVNNIAAALIKADPVNKAYYKKNASAYIGKLRALDEKYRIGLKNTKSRDIVTSHNAFAYLAARYGLNQIPISGLAEQEPSAARLAQISEFAKKHQTKYIFFEKLVGPRLSDTIARETGAKTLVLNPIEGLTHKEQEDGKDFISISEENLANLRLALGAK